MYLIALAAIAIGVGSFFKISDIQVSGNVLYSDQELIETAGIETGKNLFLLDTGAVSRRIMEEKRYVDSVRIRRRLPDTIQIEVRESQLLAYLQYGSDLYVLNRRCEILSKGDEASVAGYIYLSGIEALSPRVGEKLALSGSESGKLRFLEDVMAELLEREIYRDVQSIDLENPAAMKLRYKGRFTVILGGNESLGKKFNMLEEILEDRSEYDAGIIDLSTPGEGHFIPG